MTMFKLFYEDLSRGKERGEDAIPYVADDTIIAVADGLGGRGAEKYKSDNGVVLTGATIAANTALKAVAETHRQGLLTQNALTENIIDFLKKAKDQNIKIDCGIRSSMFKEFPTTIAVGEIFTRHNKLFINTFWCGDSRVYAIVPNRGLIQLTEDDLEDKCLDPYTNITQQDAMSQFISISKPFAIHQRQYPLGKNAIVFAASDGVFEYQ